MQSFVTTGRVEPCKADVAERLGNFEEIYRFFNRKEVAAQALRCVQCGDPFCAAIGCPLGNYIPQWLEAIAEKDLEKAFRLSNESSPFPEILGRVCPQGRLCEGACTLDDGYGAISIGAIEASITDLGFKAGFQIEFPELRPGLSVAVIGSGPAGFSCAHFLLRAGITVEMYERAERPGGLLTWGIPGFKLDKEIVDNRFRILRKAGLHLHLGKELGRDLPLEQLLERHDAVFLGLGAACGKKAGLEGEGHPQVFMAMDYLTQMQRRRFGQSWEDRFSVLGKRVVVIGGGDTAMDCLRTAVREGADRVVCLYRRDQANMPGSRKEFHNAVEEGVEFFFNESPKQLVFDGGDALVGVEAVKTRMGEPGGDGRRRAENIEGSEHCVPADLVILALGFDAEENPFIRQAGLAMDEWGRILVDPRTGRTSHGKLYAGGDCHRGADLVVTAAADGRRAAFAIMEQLLGGE